MTTRLKYNDAQSGWPPKDMLEQLFHNHVDKT
jgi:hypothetical protein